jgi:hypothetical protein
MRKPRTRQDTTRRQLPYSSRTNETRQAESSEADQTQRWPRSGRPQREVVVRQRPSPSRLLSTLRPVRTLLPTRKRSRQRSTWPSSRALASAKQARTWSLHLERLSTCRMPTTAEQNRQTRTQRHLSNASERPSPRSSGYRSRPFEVEAEVTRTQRHLPSGSSVYEGRSSQGGVLRSGRPMRVDGEIGDWSEF